jgi:hypothetical protein
MITKVDRYLCLICRLTQPVNLDSSFLKKKEFNSNMIASE